MSRYIGEDQAPAESLPARSAAAPRITTRQETLQPLLPTNNDVDETDDDTLINQYDVSGGIGHDIFGALDTGGLEDVGEDEDEDLGLTDNGKC